MAQTLDHLPYPFDEYITAMDLCYGENKRQGNARLIVPSKESPDPLLLSRFELIMGMNPSYINMTDVYRPLETATHIGSAWEQNFGYVPLIAVAVKHGNACGAAVGDTAEDVVIKMVMGDREAISGGFVLLNFEVTEAVAEILHTHGGTRILDGVIAPQFTNGAIAILMRKNEKCRMFVNEHLSGSGLGMGSMDLSRRFRQLRGKEFLTQDPDSFILTVPGAWRSLITPRQLNDLVLGWAIGSTANSNTIVLTKDGMLIGSGTGQRSRVMACKVALLYAETYGHDVHSSVACSDSFFPFPDGPMVLADAGIELVFATSGSIRDKEVAAACEERKMQLLTLPDAEARGFYGH